MEKINRKKLIIISAVAAVLIAMVLIFVFVILPVIRKDGKDNTFDIESIEIQLDGKNVGNEINKGFIEKDFTFSVVINSNEDISGKDKPTIEWARMSTTAYTLALP